MTNKDYILLFEKFLRNEASEGEIDALLHKIGKDDDISLFFEKKISDESAQMPHEVQQRILESIRKEMHASAPSKPIVLPMRKLWRWAAILLLPIVSILITRHMLQKEYASDFNPVVVSAANGEKAEMTLADGTKVWLNSGSSLTYDNSYNRKQRCVRLDGEAYFEVAEDKSRPFIVKTDEMEVEALGTAFNVSAYRDERLTSSVLLEGKIRITASDREKILSENERLTFNKSDRTITTDIVYASDFVEWKKGNLYFENRSFDEIANTLTRVFNVEINFVSEKLRTLRFSGTLGNSSIKNALDILSMTSAMRYQMNGTTIELYCAD